MKRGSYGAPSNYSPPESQYGHNGGGGYGRPSGYGQPGGGYGRPQQYGQGGYQQGGNYPNSGFQQGGFQGQSGGFQGQNGGFQGQGQFQGDQSGFGQQGGSQTGFQASPPVPAMPQPGAGSSNVGPDYSPVGQTAPVASPGAGGLFGGGSASTGFDDPAFAADAKPEKSTTDTITETSVTGSRK